MERIKEKKTEDMKFLNDLQDRSEEDRESGQNEHQCSRQTLLSKPHNTITQDDVTLSLKKSETGSDIASLSWASPDS